MCDKEYKIDERMYVAKIKKNADEIYPERSAEKTRPNWAILRGGRRYIYEFIRNDE